MKRQFAVIMEGNDKYQHTNYHRHFWIEITKSVFANDNIRIGKWLLSVVDDSVVTGIRKDVLVHRATVVLSTSNSSDFVPESELTPYTIVEILS